MATKAADRILAALADGPLRVNPLAARLERSPSATRQALARLEKKGKVACTPDHQWSLTDGTLQTTRPEIATMAVETANGTRRLTDVELAAQRIFVPAENLEDLQKRIAKLAKRATKLGIDPPTLTVGESVIVQGALRNENYGPKRKPARVFYEVSVAGPAIRVAGWEFVARIEHTPGGNLLNAVPTAELESNELKAYRNKADWCDHCDTERRRKDTFVVRATGESTEAKGTLKQVGRNCLVDFLGHENPEGLARMAQYLHDALLGGTADPDELGYGGSYTPSTFGLVDFLAACQAFVEQDGWTSRTKARDQGTEATADQAWHYLMLIAKGDKAKAAKELVRGTTSDWEAYEAVARRALERGAVLLANSDSDYEHNLQVCLKAEIVTGKTAGYVGSLLGYVRRADEHAAKTASWGERAKGSEYLGEPKQRIKGIVAKVLRAVSIDGYYGATEIISFQTEDGNMGVCFFGGSARWLEIGRTYRFDMTVKDHQVNDRTEIAYKETKVQRIKCVARKRGDGKWDDWTKAGWTRGGEPVSLNRKEQEQDQKGLKV